MLSQRQRGLAARHHLSAAGPRTLSHLPVALHLQHQLDVLFAPTPTLPSLHTPSILREHAASCLPKRSLEQTAKRAAGSMTASSLSSTPPQPSQHPPLSFAGSEPGSAFFTFCIAPRPAMALSFLPRPSPARPRKRGRALNDIDGEHSCLQKKKRRLRLFLITSRLSPQFSHPATNIVDRGSSKIAVWAKQRSLGRNLLRKAAILNRIRRRSISTKEREAGLGAIFGEDGQEQKRLELAKLAFVYGSHDTHTRPVEAPQFPPTCAIQTEGPFGPVPSSSTASSSTDPLQDSGSDRRDDAPVYRSPNDAYSYSPSKAQLLPRSHLPLPPSPLGLSNYDAFDLEDPYSHLDDDDEEDDEDGARSPSTDTLASLTSTLSTSATGISEVTRSPPQIAFCDFSVLDHGEPVMGDYDQIDQGADPIWPVSTKEEAPMRPLLPASSSPNFAALFATASESTKPYSPNFAPAPPDGPDPSEQSVSSLKDADLEQERGRQREFMFLQFDS